MLDMVVSTLISTLFVILLSWAVMAPLVIAAAWRLLRATGRNPLLSLLLLVPYAGFLAVLVILRQPDID
ncbi:hypothetical protein [Azospirillum sp. sgz301742]